MKPCCQACGFAVYNRRYPKCESCGAVLAVGLAMTFEARSAAFEVDRAEAEREAREKKREADASASGGSGFFGDCGSVDSGGGGDGGGCGGD